MVPGYSLRTLGEKGMSYCRWSSMNSMCDVYVYEDDAGGWTTHVAAKRRILPPIPSLPLGRSHDADAEAGDAHVHDR